MLYYNPKKISKGEKRIRHIKIQKINRIEKINHKMSKPNVKLNKIRQIFE